MKKFAALATGLALTVLATAAPASAQGAFGAGAPTYGQGARPSDDGLAGGPNDRGGYRGQTDNRYGDSDGRGRDQRPDDRVNPNFQNGGWDRPDATGRTAAFFTHPRLNGRAVQVDYFRGNARRAEEAATDMFCRRVGFREGAYYSVDRSRRGAVLEDVVCIR